MSGDQGAAGMHQSKRVLRTVRGQGQRHLRPAHWAKGKPSARRKGLSFFLIFFSTFIYFRDRERQSMNGGGAEREGDTESETGSRL